MAGRGLFTPIAAGGSHSLLLTETQPGKVLCCATGTNKYGQLGTSIETHHFDDSAVHVPTEVANEVWKGQKPSMIACGATHSVLLTQQGSLYTWGSNDSGKLGIGSNNLGIRKYSQSMRRKSSIISTEETKEAAIQYDDLRIFPSPMRISSLLEMRVHVEQVSCGSDHTMCVDSNGDLWTWGGGMYGNLGHGDSKDRWEPERVVALQGAGVVVASGGAKHSACVTRNGQLFTWGNGDNGRLGNGDQRGTSLPEHVDAFESAVDLVACGEAHTVAVLDSGKVLTWGLGTYGRLGHGEESDVYVPMQVMGLSQSVVATVSAGVFHTLASCESGLLYAWGGGQHGKLGLGDTDNRFVPTRVKAIPETLSVIAVACGHAHSMCTTHDGSLFAWGSNGSGRIGISSAVQKFLPTVVPSGIFHNRSSESKASISTSSKSVSIALPSDSRSLRSSSGRSRLGTVESNELAALIAGGDTGPLVTPVPDSLRRSTLGTAALFVQKVSCGAHHSVALTQGGSLVSWGGNANGQLGIGSQEDQHSPVQINFGKLVVGQPTVVDVACGMEYTLCVMERGDVFAWGRGTESQLGTGNLVDELSPVSIQTLHGKTVVRVAAGEDHSAAVTAGGALYTWGSLENGKLGQGRVSPHTPSELPSNALVSLPRRVTGKLEGEAVTSVSLGASHSACVTASGKLFAWGGGWYGRLGLGSFDNQHEPALVIGIEAPVEQVACGAFHTLARTVDGQVYAWGRGDQRLGLGNVGNTALPALVLGFRTTGVRVVDVVAAEEHSLALGEDGSVWTWGRDGFGKLGRIRDESSGQLSWKSEDRSHPALKAAAVAQPAAVRHLSLGVTVPGLEDIRMLACKANHILAVAQNGKVYAWGCAGSGRLGIGQVGDAVGFRNAQSLPFFNTRTRDLEKARRGRSASSASGGTSAPRGEQLESDRRRSLGTEEAGGGEAAEVHVPGAFQGEAESAVRGALDNGECLPIWAVQELLKAEPAFCREEALRTSRSNVQQREAQLYQSLKEASIRKQNVAQVEHSLQYVLTSTIRKLGNISTEIELMQKQQQRQGTDGSSVFSRFFGKRGWNLFRGQKTGQESIPKTRHQGAVEEKEHLDRSHPNLDLLPKLPIYTQMFTLLLMNPYYLGNIHRVWVVDGHIHFSGFTTSLERENLFLRLVYATYDLNDSHCVHLYIRLCELVLTREINVFKEKYVEAEEGGEKMFEALTEPQLGCSTFLKLVKHLMDAVPQVHEWLQDQLGEPIIELLHGKYSQTDSGQNQDLFHDPFHVQTCLKTAAHERNVGKYKAGNQSDPAVRQSGPSSPRKRTNALKDPRVRQEVKSRLNLLGKVTQAMFAVVVEGAPSVPRCCKWLCALINKVLVQQFQDRRHCDIELVVGRFFFDMVLKEAIEEPQVKGVLPRSFGQPQLLQSQNLQQVSKLMRVVTAKGDWTGFEEDVSKSTLNGLVEQTRSQVLSFVKQIVENSEDLDVVLLTDAYQEALRPSHEPLTLIVAEKVIKFLRYVMFHPTRNIVTDSTQDPLFRLAHGEEGILVESADRVRAGYFVSEIHDRPRIAPISIIVNLNFMEQREEGGQSALSYLSGRQAPNPTGEQVTRRKSAGRRWSCSSATGVVDVLEKGAKEEVVGLGIKEHPKEKLVRPRDFLILDKVSRAPVPSWMPTSRTIPLIEESDSLSGATGMHGEFRELQKQLVDLPALDRTVDDRWDVVEAFQKRLDELTQSQQYELAAQVNVVIKQLEDIHLSNFTLDTVLRQIVKDLLQRRELVRQLEMETRALSKLQHETHLFHEHVEKRKNALLEYMRLMQEGRAQEKEYMRLMHTAGNHGELSRLTDPDFVQKLHLKPSSILESKRYSNHKRREFAMSGSFKGSFGNFSYKEMKRKRILISFDVHLLNKEAVAGTGLEDRRKAKTFLQKTHFVFCSARPGGYFQIFVVYDSSSVVETIEVSMQQLQDHQRHLETVWRPRNFPLLEFRISTLCELLEQLEVGLIVV